MKNNILFSLLKSMNKKELNKLGQFVHSVYHNQNPNVIALVDYFVKIFPEANTKLLKPDLVYQIVYDSTSFNKAKLNSLYFETSKLVERFFIQTKLENNEALKQELLLSALLGKRLDKIFEKRLKKTQQAHSQTPIRDRQYFYQQYLLEQQADLFERKKRKMVSNPLLQNKVDQLDLFYLLSKLRESCEMMNRQNILSIQYEMRLLTEVLAHIEAEKAYYQNFPSVMIYYQVLLMLKDFDEERHYYALKKLLSTDNIVLQRIEVREIFQYAQNYCIKKVNSGKDIFMGELLGWFKRALGLELLTIDGYLLEWDYKNIVTVGLRLKEYDWTKEFIHQYKDELRKEVQENAFHYNLATYYYGMGDYEKAVATMLAVELTDVVYYLGSKSLLLKIYYETNESEALYALLEAFRIYLLRNKVLSKYQRSIYQNLIRFTKRAYKIKQEQDFQTTEHINYLVEQLKMDIETHSNIANKAWLVKKIQDLLSK